METVGCDYSSSVSGPAVALAVTLLSVLLSDTMLCALAVAGKLREA